MIQDIKVDDGALGSYKNLMPKSKEKRSELVGTMVTAAAKELLESVAENNDRSLSYVASALLMRGIAAYERDGKLLESETLPNEGKRPATIRVPTITLNDKAAKDKKRA